MNITIYDSNLAAVGLLDAFDSLIWNDKYMDVGSFELVVKMSDANLNLLQTDRFLSIPYSSVYMVIETLEIKSDIENGDKLTVTGRPLVSILDRRIIWNQTNLTGSFQTAIQTLLNENVISATNTDRRIPNFQFVTSTDPTIVNATIVREQFYGENLLAVIQALCYARNFGFKVYMDSGVMKFLIYYGVDRSFQQLSNAQIVFSPEFDNLLTSDYVESIASKKTVSLVAGEGSGSDMKTISVAAAVDGALTGILRREAFTDAKDTSSTTTGGTLTTQQYNDLLTEKGQIDLAEQVDISSFGADVDATVSFVYGEDFFLGDIVQAQNEYGLQGPMRVSEITVAEDITGFKIFPTFEML
jgi:hypothetical protein